MAVSSPKRIHKNKKALDVREDVSLFVLLEEFFSCHPYLVQYAFEQASFDVFIAVDYGCPAVWMPVEPVASFLPDCPKTLMFQEFAQLLRGE